MKRSAPSARKAARYDFLPQVTEAEAASLRQELQQRRFVPTTNRLPDEVIPNAECITVIDQGQEGVSVGVALAAVLNYLRAEQGERRPVSARMLYEYARVYDEFPGADYEGSSLGGGLAGLGRHGVCLESEWPLYDPRTTPDAAALEAAGQNRPSAIRLVDRSVNELRAAVFEHHAVVAAATLHDGWREPIHGTIVAPRGQRRHDEGAHAFAVVGYTREGFVVQNSWGPAWGGVSLRDRKVPGLALWTYEDAAAHLLEAWVVQLARRPFRPPLVGYDADSLEGDDLLEIRADEARIGPPRDAGGDAPQAGRPAQRAAQEGGGGRTRRAAGAERKRGRGAPESSGDRATRAGAAA
jgi:hypothetical protein